MDATTTWPTTTTTSVRMLKWMKKKQSQLANWQQQRQWNMGMILKRLQPGLKKENKKTKQKEENVLSPGWNRWPPGIPPPDTQSPEVGVCDIWYLTLTLILSFWLPLSLSYLNETGHCLCLCLCICLWICLCVYLFVCVCTGCLKKLSFTKLLPTVRPCVCVSQAWHLRCLTYIKA